VTEEYKGKECLEAAVDVTFPDRTQHSLKVVYQDSPLEEESRNFQTTLKKLVLRLSRW
jgi:hypothetical protein